MARSMIWVILGCILIPLLAQAGPNDKLAQRLAANCAGCHGTAGVAAGGSLPALAGQPKDSIVANMLAFKSGARPATVMHQLAKGYTDEQIEMIAGYFSGLKTSQLGGAR
ncbi:MAG: c-type cytochrome [Pseudomonadota bacterium]